VGAVTLVAWALVAELAGGIVSIGADIVFGLVVTTAREEESGLTSAGNGVY
jgi:hypothetical protein